MYGIFLSVLAGVFISLQGIFNSRVSPKIGFWETTAYVHIVGVILALFMVLVAGKGDFTKILEVKKIYLLGGTFGVIIVFSVMKGISLLGPTYSVAILLITQLLITTLIECFGFFEVPPISFPVYKSLGLMLMLIGIIVFNSKS